MIQASTKIAILNLGSQVLSQVKIPQLLHKCLFRTKLAILVYHAVVRSPLEIYNTCFLDEVSFRNQVTYLKKRFDVLLLSEAVEKMRRGEISRPTAVITFDDGFQNNYDVAFPILREAGLPATIFLTTALVNTEDTFWYLRLNRALAKTNNSYLKWNGHSLDLRGQPSKVKAEVAIRSTLRELPRPKLLAELRKIIQETGDDPDCPIESDSPFRMLNSKAIKEMLGSGLVEFGAHSHTHPRLSRLSSKECLEEIRLSVSKTEEFSEHPCKLFAYPFGYPQHYNAETIRILKECGVRIAVTGVAGPNDMITSPMELRRYGIDANTSMAVFQIKVHHLYAPILKLT